MFYVECEVIFYKHRKRKAIMDDKLLYEYCPYCGEGFRFMYMNKNNLEIMFNCLSFCRIPVNAREFKERMIRTNACREIQIDDRKRAKV